MDLNTVLELLLTVENGEDAKKFLEGHIAKLEEDAKNQKAAALKAKAGNKDEQEKFAAALSFQEKLRDLLELTEDDGDIESALSKLKTEALAGKDKDGQEAAKELVKLKGEFNRLDREHKKVASLASTFEQQFKEERQKRHSSLVESALLAELIKRKAISPAKLSKMLALDVTVDDMDELTMKVGSDILDIESGIEVFLKDNPEFVRAEHIPGAGSNSGGSAGVQPQGKGGPLSNIGERLVQMNKAQANNSGAKFME